MVGRVWWMMMMLVVVDYYYGVKTQSSWVAVELVLVGEEMDCIECVVVVVVVAVPLFACSSVLALASAAARLRSNFA